jgi:hypothetical protein
VEKKTDMDGYISSYYGEDQVSAVITIKVDTKEADKVATQISKFDIIEDVFLVTGDTGSADFSGRNNSLHGGGDAPLNLGERVNTGDLAEDLGPGGVEADVDAAEAGLPEARRLLRQE